MKVKTIMPENRPSEEEWMRMFNVSSRYEDKAYIKKANEIMDSWGSKIYQYKQLIKNLKTNNYADKSK